MPTPLHHRLKGIALDTNMLIAIERKRVDVFSLARQLAGERVVFVVTEEVKRELQELQAKGKAMRRAVIVALRVLEKERTHVLETKAGSADASLVEAAKQGFWVATLDRALRKRIKEVGGSVIYLKQNRLLKEA